MVYTELNEYAFSLQYVLLVAAFVLVLVLIDDTLVLASVF